MKLRQPCVVASIVGLVLSSAAGCSGKSDQAGPGPDTPQAPRTDCWGESSSQDGCAPNPQPDASDVSDVSDVCLPACDGQECGDDGCGGTCGQCPLPTQCNAGQCVEVECWDGNDVPWDGCNGGQIAEVKVNEYWIGPQAYPAVAAWNDGAFAVAWQGKGEGDNQGVWLRHYDADGDSKAPEVLVNEFTYGDQEHPSLAVSDSGTIVVAWNGFGDEDDHGIYLRRFGKDGVPLGPQELVNTFTDKTQEAASVAPLAGGGFVVAWASLGKVMFNHEICARLYAEDGSPTGDELIVNLVQDNDQQSPVVAGVPLGGFAVAWASKPQDGSGYGVFARVFDAGGVPLGEDVQVNSYAMGMQWTPWIASLAGGGFAVAWDGEGAHDDWGISGKVLDADLLAVSDEMAINTVTAADQYGPRIAGLTDGRFLVAWESFTEAYVDPDAEGDVFTRVYDFEGKPLTEASVPINSWFFDGQGDPSVAAMPDGGWIVVWYSFAQDGDERGIFALRFDADGKKVEL